MLAAGLDNCPSSVGAHAYEESQGPLPRNTFWLIGPFWHAVLSYT